MATVRITDFSFQKESSTEAQMDVKFTLQHSATEKKHDIPTHVWLRLMDRDLRKDRFHLFQDSVAARALAGQVPAVTRIGDVDPDDPATGWMFAGTFPPNQLSGSFTRKLDPTTLNKDPFGREVWYVLAISRPDLICNVAYSEDVPLPFP